MYTAQILRIANTNKGAPVVQISAQYGQGKLLL